MTTDEQQIRDLIQTWVTAVDAGDEAGTVAHRTDDIVMFDVPGPTPELRGTDEYRATWPPFLDFQRSGAVFELRSLDVTAGDDVAFAHALLRCGPGEGPDTPEARLRLTVGLRKEGGQWLVAHEHHSFADLSQGEAERTEQELHALHDRWFAATAAKDLDGLMAPVADDVVSYEHEEPLVHRGTDEVRVACQRGLESGPEAAWTIPDLQIHSRGDLAVTWGLNRTAGAEDGEPREWWSRGTRVFRRSEDGRWTMVHQHVSFPMDLETGQARTDLRPEQ